MLQSFVVYGMFAFAMLGLGLVSAKRERISQVRQASPRFWTWDIVFALLVFAFVSGIRYNVGVDYLEYLKNYLTAQNSGYLVLDKELGFDALTNLFADLGFHFAFYFGFLAFIQIFFIYRAFKDQRYLYPFLAIIIILGPHYLSWMNGIRQMIVAAIFVWSVQFIINRDWKAYFFSIVLASLIHKSAVLLLPFYFLPQKNIFGNRYLTLSLVVASLYLGGTSLWVDLVGSPNSLLQFIGYEGYSENLGRLIDETQDRNIGPRKVSIIITVGITIWLFPRLKKYFGSSGFVFMFNLAVAGLILSNLLHNAHHIFLRPITYLTIFYAPVTAYTLVFLKRRSKYYFPLFLLLLACSLSYLPMSIIADSEKGVSDYTNYRFFWYHEHDE